MLAGGIKAHIPVFFDKIDRCSPKWTADEIATIRENIVKLKVIPTLRYIPDEFYNFTKKVWWLVPFTIWKEEIVGEMEIEWPEDNLCVLTVYNRGSEGFLTFSEFVSEGCG